MKCKRCYREISEGEYCDKICERMKDQPIDNMANIELVIAMTKYLYGMEKRTYTFEEMDNELKKCWKLVLKGRGISLPNDLEKQLQELKNQLTELDFKKDDLVNKNIELYLQNSRLKQDIKDDTALINKLLETKRPPLPDY